MADTLVLCYHAVSERWPASLSVTPGHFDTQLQTLRDRGYRGVTFLEASTATADHDRVAVTFDDAFRSVLELAFPALELVGWPATLFVPTEHVGKPGPMAWDGIDQWIGGEHERELHALRWDEIRELAEAGWEIGSHTRTHPKLTQLGDGYRLTLVGTGKLEAQMRAAAAPFADRVRFLGYVAQGPDLFRLYREADVFVHAARTEGLPQVLIEAQAFGLPAVGTDVGGVAGALGDGQAGLLVPPGDATALADAVRRLVGDEALREGIRAAGRARTRNLTLERQAAKAAAFLLGESA